jgi:uncharacterized membrane protein
MSERLTLATYVAVLAVATFWAAGAVLAPVLACEAGPASEPNLASVLYAAYGHVCHQIADRSFHILELPVAVCARCTGIYCGYVAGLAAYPIVRPLRSCDTPPRAWLIIAVAPAVIDFAGGYLGLFDNTAASRAVTGAVAGAAGAFYTLPGLVCVVRMRAERRRSAVA